MTREQIVKALECCIKVGGYRMDEHYCVNCPLFDTRCALLLPQNALSLINELTEENKKSKATRYMAHPDDSLEMIPSVESVRADTVRKMQERLKANRVCRDGLSFKLVDFEAIDRVAAEMLDGE